MVSYWVEKVSADGKLSGLERIGGVKEGENKEKSLVDLKMTYDYSEERSFLARDSSFAVSAEGCSGSLE